MADTTQRSAAPGASGATSDASPSADRATTEGADGLAAAGFEQVIGRLRGVVERLETGSLGLEQALAAFEEGVRLSRRGAEILDQAERRVEVLTRGADGRVEAVPMAPGAASGAGDGDAPA